MINTERVAVFNHIEQLQKDALSKFILAKVPVLAEDLGEQVAILTMEGNAIGMGGGKLVETDLVQVQFTSMG